MFIVFAEDKRLLPENTVKDLIATHSQNNQKGFGAKEPLYAYFKRLFVAIDKGDSSNNIAKFNGGLFAYDEFLDQLSIDDSALNLDIISKYDFDSDISVNILGHIFEQSLNDLEEINSQINGDNFDKTKSKRKKDGIFYTPEFITHYIVQNTIGKLCDDKKSQLGIKFDDDVTQYIKSNKKDKITLSKEGALYKEQIYAYREFLLELKILDPACGSGAFLNQALEFLLSQHSHIDAFRRILENESLGLYDVAPDILEKNLYGVDINADAVEIAKLSLWLRTAVKDRALTKLSDNIKCANSLLEFPFDFKFDCVIGNPPYVRQESIKDIKPKLEKIYKVYSGTADLFVYFYELGLTSLREGGKLGFICSNKFFRANYGKNLRKYILDNASVNSIVDFNAIKIFEDATVDSAITIFQKTTSLDNTKFEYFAPQDSEFDLNKVKFELLAQSTLSEQIFTFVDDTNFGLKTKIEAIGTSLKEWDINIYRGILTGLNEAFIIGTATKDQILDKCVNLDEKERTAKLIKPILRGRDIKRYSYKWADLWVINTHNGYKNQDEKILAIDIYDYPALKAYLDKFEPKLSKRSDKGTTPYNLRNCAYINEFEKEKIIYSEIVREPQFYLDNNEHFFAEATSFILTAQNDSINLRYLTGLLHSNLVTFAFKKWYAGGGLGSGYRYKKQYLENLPIPKVTNENKTTADEIINLVEQILSSNEKINKYEKYLNKLNLDEKIEAKEQIEILENIIKLSDEKIENLVYKLYNLTDEEVKIIQNSLRNKK
ncbi:Eco57I restriction-modification methylase domain-containing protein [Campylobacter fetus]|uniref:Eco57I restriction-modification methylase domain-containing protein n=1 Tax=Campylobacter fetus TaxID=196 RepID=UPI000818B512